jgi:hypothetical protein
MAITTTTVKINAGWARTDVIGQLEEAFSWLGWHGDTLTGIATGIISYTGGGTVSTVSTTYEDVEGTSTSGIGTGASFRIYRSSGNINTVHVNRPGYGYTDGETIEISAEDIGGSGAGAGAMEITVAVAGNETPVEYGALNLFYDKDVTPGSSYPWGVMRHTIQENKKFGDTYRGFNISGSTSLTVNVGSAFYPWDDTSTTNKNGYYPNRFAGTSYVDRPNSMTVADYYDRTTDRFSDYYQVNDITFASSTSYDLDLNIFRSSEDPNFAVLSFRHPYLSSTNLNGNTYATFFIHNYTTPLWDLDNLFLGGMTQIIPDPGSDPRLEFRTYMGSYSDNYGRAGFRSAEFGYDYVTSAGDVGRYKSFTYESNSFPGTISRTNATFYLRDSSTIRGQNISSDANFNAVIKGLPINGLFVPVPYYIPDDFVMIDFKYSAPSTNIQQGDTITISPSEIYTVITGSYNQSGSTRGILFCARTV